MRTPAPLARGWHKLCLILDLIFHARAHWRSWRKLAKALFNEGGATIDTPSLPGLAPLRTLIQADGDVLVIVHQDDPLDEEVLRRHGQRVDDWYTQVRAALRRAEVMLEAVAAPISSIPSAWSGWRAWGAGPADGITAVVPAAVASVVVFFIVRKVVGWVAYALLKTRIDKWLGGAGITG